MRQDDYYIIERENNDDYPLVTWAQEKGDFGLGKPVINDQVVELQLAEPISPTFKWADYHANSMNPVVSKKIAHALQPLDIYGVQFIPASVYNPLAPSDEKKPYFLMHVWHRIHCLDQQNSELERYDDGSIFSIEALALNNNTLADIELNKRLIFELGENTSVLLVHKIIKEHIQLAQPSGCRFFRASEWYSDIVFD